MRSFRRVGTAVVFSVCLAAAPAAAAPTDAATDWARARQLSLSEACTKLTRLIDYLEGLPESRLRDFLLKAARRMFDRSCSVS